METFGLLQLLNTLLPKNPQEEEKTTPSPAETSPAPPPVNAEKPNACAQFFERHEHRAKNLPKRE